MLWKLQPRVPVNEFSCWKPQRPANKAAKPGIRLHKRLTLNANWKGLKPGSLQHMSTGFRGVKQKIPRHPLLSCFAAQLYVCFSQHLVRSIIQIIIQVTTFIISGNPFFHSTNSYISLCRHLELVRLTLFLCWHFQSPANEKLSLAGLPAQILLWMPGKHDGRWIPAKCARGVERRYTWQGSWERLFVFTHCSLLLFKSEDEQVLSYNGWFRSKFGQISRDTHACKAHAHTDVYAWKEYSSEYSLFLWYVFLD